MNADPTLQFADSASKTRGVLVSGSTPARILRVEALAIAIASMVAYRWVGGGWGMYFGLWLVPDLFMVGYLLNPRVGSIGYNLSHNLVLPVGLCAVGAALSDMFVLQLGFIWLSHVAIDRALGFGLKYASAFRDTHLGRV